MTKRPEDPKVPNFLGSFENTDEAATESLWHLDNIAEGIGWGKPPKLIVIANSKVANTGLSAIELESFLGWDLILNKFEELTEMLSWLTLAMKIYPSERRHKVFKVDKMYGLALIAEAHMAEGDLETVTDIVQSVKSEEEFRASPRTSLVRMVYSCSKDGKRAVLYHKKDGIADLFTDQRLVTAGEVPDLLEALVKALIA
jgi:hypothetical protein